MSEHAAATRFLSRSEVQALCRINGEDFARLESLQPVRVTRHYASLIDWEDPADPLRRIVAPSMEEWGEGGLWDPSSELSYTPVPGLQHKYGPTALLLVSDQCASYCRFCFRKRVFAQDNAETLRAPDQAIEYLGGHPEIREVILSGGDPLFLGNRALRDVLHRVVSIASVRTVRIHTKALAFDPERIDRELLSILEGIRGKVNLLWGAHFDHPRELTDAARRVIRELRGLRLDVYNQCPLLRGVNDSGEVLAELFRGLNEAGCTPYYLFQLRPVAHGLQYVVPLVKGIEVLADAFSRCTGAERRVRYVMSHASGKIEILGCTAEHIVLRRLSSADVGSLTGELMMFRRDNTASWLEDLVAVGRDRY